ncbi:MAG: hypothetical protein L0Y35_00130 [Flammeovirgaceae bacterium]|nr:hypothetical protein [Flammeovirgaceae bacterium]
MTKVGLIKFIAILFAVSPAFGQKVKYKDLFELLVQKRYEESEPFLKRYLKDNQDNPNAFLYMGIIFQEKSMKDDVLKQTDRAIKNMDSAILFFDKAYKTIDEKEVRREKEYYQIYNRRDLRTGEFGVKLSDVQFDLEKKIEGLKERKDKVKIVRFYFDLAQDTYRRAHELYISMQDAYPGLNELMLRSDENTVQNLEQLSSQYDSSSKAFDNYKTSSQNLGRTGYNQNFTPQDIIDFKRDGRDMVDFFFQDDLIVWDYKKFADKTKETITKEVFPIRENLVTYDIEINKLRERLTKDSVSVRSDLTKLVDKILKEQLNKFDPSPMPMEVFELKITDLEYKSLLMENKSRRDSADVHFHASLISDEFKAISKLDSLSGKMVSEDMEKNLVNYNHFITNTYSNGIVLKSFIRTLKEYAERERAAKQMEYQQCMESLKWVVNGTDSIPLVNDVASKFKPLVVVPDKYTSGIMFSDSTSGEGYFFTITPSRRPDVKVKFPVDKTNFRETRLNGIKSLTTSDAGGQVFFVLIYSDRLARDKYPVTLSKIYRTDGLSWSNNFGFGFVPKEILFKPETGEITVKADDQVAVIDKNGKQVR